MIVISCSLCFSSLLRLDHNPIFMLLLQWSWENYTFSKIHFPSKSIEGIMTLNVFISSNCQQFSVAIYSLTLKWSRTVSTCSVRLALTEIQLLLFPVQVSAGLRGFLCLTINSNSNKIILLQNRKTSGTRSFPKQKDYFPVQVTVLNKAFPMGTLSLKSKIQNSYMVT